MGTVGEGGHVDLATTMKKRGWAVFFVPRKAQMFSVGRHRHVLRTWLPGQAGEKATF